MTRLDGKKILVTGADGFIGSHLVERLLDDGASIRALCMYNSNGSLGWLEDINRERRSLLDVRLGDIRDGGFVRAAVDGVDIVFHLAALISIPYSYVAPASFVETNVIGTLNLLEAMRHLDTRRLVNTSTSEVYGTPTTIPIQEGHPLRGQSPYSATKIAADMLCESYARSFAVPVVTLRPFNTYGPRQSARAVIPTILGQLLAGVREVRLGSLHPRRDFTYVTDTVDGFARMAVADIEPGTTIQLGTGQTISVSELFRRCCAILGVEAEPLVEPKRIRPEPSEVDVLLSDPSLAAELLGWAPTIELDDGLRRTAAWLEGRLDDATVDRYNR